MGIAIITAAYSLPGDGISAEVSEAVCIPLNLNVAVKILSTDERLADLEVSPFCGLFQ